MTTARGPKRAVLEEMNSLSASVLSAEKLEVGYVVGLTWQRIKQKTVVIIHVND